MMAVQLGSPLSAVVVSGKKTNFGWAPHMYTQYWTVEFQLEIQYLQEVPTYRQESQNPNILGQYHPAATPLMLCLPQIKPIHYLLVQSSQVVLAGLPDRLLAIIRTLSLEIFPSPHPVILTSGYMGYRSISILRGLWRGLVEVLDKLLSFKKLKRRIHRNKPHWCL